MIKENDIHQKRIEAIFNMLIEVSRGNFSYKIRRTHHNDDLEALSLGLNMTVEQIREVFSHYPYINPHNSYRYFMQMSFILNHQYYIESFNAFAPNILYCKENQLQNQPFENLLTEESVELWKIVKKKIEHLQHCTAQLTFSVGCNFLLPAFCTISKLNRGHGKPSGILLTSAEIVLQENLADHTISVHKNNGKTGNTSPSMFGKNRDDIQLLQKVHDHILANLEKPFPSIQQLANDFGINRTKLRNGFKSVFNTTIYDFYNNERLKKAHFLVKHSGISLSQIAEMCGFRNYPNFSKAFKKKFSLSPQQFKKRLSEI